MAKQFVRPVALKITDHNFLRTEVVMPIQLVKNQPGQRVLRCHAYFQMPEKINMQGKCYLSVSVQITARLGAKLPMW